MRLVLAAACAAAGARALLPKFPSTYNMSQSTMIMPCNDTGFMGMQDIVGKYGIIDVDWSNAKQLWANAHPMNAEEMLLQQAKISKAAACPSACALPEGCAKKNACPLAKVWVYRNLVKALPWFTSVREKLDDPAYSGWFLRFAPKSAPYHVPACAAENASKCSGFYHDQEQTPQVPTAKQPHPDGSCGAAGCDCGAAPCGEFLWDHRNGSMLRDWLVSEHIGGTAGLGSAAVDGLFVDDFWCSDQLCTAANDTLAGCPCNDPVQGPTEIDRNFQSDAGLSDRDIAELTTQWNATMSAFQESALAKRAYTWSLIPGQENANAMPTLLHAPSCAAAARARCGAAAPTQSQAWLFGLTVNGSVPTQVEQDVAFFLLARGPYAWLGWGVWGMGWPFNPEPAHGGLPPQPHGVARPAALDVDYGEPASGCAETSAGVFRRAWTKADVELDCNTFRATIQMK